MSSSILTEPELHPIAMETNIQEESETIEEAKERAKRFLRIGRFYWTNAGFPKELDRSKDEYTKSPLRSFRTLPPSRPLLFERELLRVSIDTTIRVRKIKRGKNGHKNPLNYKRPCYLAQYDKSTNQGVIFLGTSKVQDNVHRFAIVQSRSPMHPLQLGSLGTNPPYSFKEKNTYLNISHPLRVQFVYLQNGKFPRTEKEGILYDDHMPPLVSIANFATQSSDVPVTPNDGLETSIVFDKKSEQLFWEKHKKYHRNRLCQLALEDDSGGAGPDGGGPSASGGGPSASGAGPSAKRTRPSASGVGPSTSGAGPSTSGAGPSTSGCSSCEAKDALWGRVGDQLIGIDIPLVTEDIYSNSDEEMDLEELEINSNAEDAPWGRVGDQCIGIDIPLMTEDIYSDSDLEMDLEELVINSNANDAPWGRVGDQRIGIDIPLVTEDIYSDSNEEMDLELPKEFQEVGNVEIVVKPESSSPEVITIWQNPIDEDSSLSCTIPKPYFVIYVPLQCKYILLYYNCWARDWKWTHRASKEKYIVVLIEGLIYERPSLSNIGTSEPRRRIFNWHTKKYIVLPSPPDECFNLDNPIVGMIVDTSVQPYAFKVIEGSERGTVIYDSTTRSWIPRRSVPPPFSKHRVRGNASVASCKGVVFIIDSHYRIVLYDTKNDKWDCVLGPRERVDERLCGIGSWDDRVFSSTICMSQNANAFEIRELVGMAKLEWKEFDAMPKEMWSWLTYGSKDSRDFRIDVSYCSEILLIWALFDFSPERFVLCNLARMTWEMLELPFLKMEGYPGKDVWDW